MPMKSEIIIPSYNRIPILVETVRKIRLLYPEIPLCIGLQGDRLSAEPGGLSKKDSNMRIEYMQQPGTTRMLNHCISTSHADIVLILDDDAIPHFGWLEAHIAAFSTDRDLVYTSGRVIEFTRLRSAFSELFRIIVEVVVGLFISKDKKIKGRIIGWMTSWGLSLTNPHLPGVCKINSPREGNMGIRRSEFVLMEGFNQEFKGNAWGFGCDFGLRLAKQNKYGKYIGNALVIHHEAASGGSRQAAKRQWYTDFLHNHKILIRNLGTQAWIGSLPRLIKKRFFS
jgi:hypothetical protein